MYFALSDLGKFTSNIPYMFVWEHYHIYNIHYSTCRVATLWTHVQMSTIPSSCLMFELGTMLPVILPLSPCVIYVISKKEGITTKLFCWLFLCRGKQKWLLCFMPLFFTGIMISYMLDDANYIAPLYMLSCFLKQRDKPFEYDSNRGRNDENTWGHSSRSTVSLWGSLSQRQREKKIKCFLHICPHPPKRRDNQLWVPVW